MKKLKWIAPLIFLAIALGGCPYSSEAPIDEPTVAINPQFLGKWKMKGSEESTYTVTQKTDYTYAVVKKNKETGETNKYTAFISRIDKDDFLNFSEDLAEAKQYYLHKVNINATGTEITLQPVTENITEKFKTSEELKAFITKYKSLSFFYELENDVMIKVK